jgi:pseudouridine synthase
MKVRINKFLSICGLGSRRKVEELILAGEVKLNGKTVKELSVIIDSETDVVKYNGEVLNTINISYYLMLNKPKGYITTLSDEKGRAVVMDLIPEKFKRSGVVPIGRLDKDTEGLLLFTNDGKLAHKLTGPSFKVKKEYLVQLDKPLEESDRLIIEKGYFVHQIKTKTKPAKVSVTEKSRLFVKVIIIEGKKRQIRYSFKNLGYNVLKLKRTGYGPISLGRLNKGDHRILKTSEVKILKNALSET